MFHTAGQATSAIPLQVVRVSGLARSVHTEQEPSYDGYVNQCVFYLTAPDQCGSRAGPVVGCVRTRVQGLTLSAVHDKAVSATYTDIRCIVGLR